MLVSVSISDLRSLDVAIAPHEAVAIAQLLIARPDASESVVRPPFGPLGLDTVVLGADGSVVSTCSAATPAVSEVAILLNAMLPPEHTRVPGGLRYAISRALLEVDAPPFDSIGEFSRALARFEHGEREEVVRALMERAEAAAEAARSRPARTNLIAMPVAATTVSAGARSHVERRRAGAGIDEVRRQLREADRAYFETFVALDEAASAAMPRPVKRRAPLVVAASLAAAIVAIAAGHLISLRHAPAHGGALTSTTTAAPAGVVAPGPVPARRVQQPADAPQDNRPAPRRTDLQNGTIDRLAANVDALVPALDAQRRPVFSPAFASNGTAMFFHTGRDADERSALMAADITSPDLRIMSILDDGARNYHVQPSPDGRLIAFDSDRDGDRGVYIANRDGSNVRRVSGVGYAAVPTWAPDGRRLAFVRAESSNPRVWNLWLLTLDTREIRRLTHFTYGETWSASWFPDGERLCYAHEDKLVVLDLPSGRSQQYDSPIAHRLVRTPAVSPDGSKVIFQVYRQGAWLLDLADGTMRCVLSDPTAEEFAWAPDGRRVAFHSRRDGNWGIYLLAPRS